MVAMICVLSTAKQHVVNAFDHDAEDMDDFVKARVCISMDMV